MNCMGTASGQESTLVVLGLAAAVLTALLFVRTARK